MIDRKLFFDRIRTSLFAGHLTQSQVSGIEAILDAWQADAGNQDLRHLAYMLATAYHETAATMQPVRETLAHSDEAAIAILDDAFRKGRLSSVREPYWRRDADGRSWLGRGLVQLTHKANYQKLGDAIGVDLLADPDRAMETAIAVRILFAGMREGLFTGKKLSDYLGAGNTDWRNARRIINGTDRMALVASRAKAFAAAINEQKG